MTGRAGRALRTGLWSAALVTGIRALSAAGRGPLAVPLADPAGLRDWAASTPPPEMAVALLRVGALALAGYLLAVTAAAMLSRAVRVPALVVAADRLSPLIVRRLVTGGSGIGLALGAVAGSVPLPDRLPGPDRGPVAAAHGSAAAPLDAPGALARAAPPDTATMTRVTAAARDPGDAARPLGVPAPGQATLTRLDPHGGPPAARLPEVDPSRWIVEPGDSLWSIAEDVTRHPDGSLPGDRVVGRYWRRLVDANRARLADPANPDLLVPGQRLVVPRAGG